MEKQSLMKLIHHGNNNFDNEVEKVETVNKVDVSIGDTSKDKTNADESTEENEDDKKNELSSSQKKDVKEYLSGVYEVSEDKITIN